MRHNATRHIASIVLLATYLPMVILSSLHVHHETVDPIDDCQQCSGHLETQHHHQCDCLYCHFLSLDYVVQANMQSTTTFPNTETICNTTTAPVVQSCYGVLQQRAPPAA